MAGLLQYVGLFIVLPLLTIQVSGLIFTISRDKVAKGSTGTLQLRCGINEPNVDSVFLIQILRETTPGSGVTEVLAEMKGSDTTPTIKVTGEDKGFVAGGTWDGANTFLTVDMDMTKIQCNDARAYICQVTYLSLFGQSVKVQQNSTFSVFETLTTAATPAATLTTATSDGRPYYDTSTDGLSQHVNNVTCFSCDDLSYVELCDVVKHCGLNEFCYLKSYVKFGRRLYRSGCMLLNTCLQEKDSYQHFPDKCVECCSDNYCNYKGCGDDGLVSRNQRGPLCFDCSYERTPEDCNKLTLCEQNEFCSIEEFKWGEHSHFIMGCTDEQCARSSRSVHVVRRALPVCRSCCTDDYCNRNCTRKDEGPILVG